MTDNFNEYATVTLKFKSFDEAKIFTKTIPKEINAKVNLNFCMEYQVNFRHHNNLNMCCEWEKYGKGWLLVPEYEDHPHWGTKYYCGGWWMPAKNAWFFRKEAAKKFYEEFEKKYI